MSNFFSRRTFIKASGGAIALQALNSSLLPSTVMAATPAKYNHMGIMLAASPGGANDYNEGRKKPNLYKIENNLFYSYDMDKKIFRELEIPIAHAHETVLNPVKDVAVIIEQDGPFACVVDYRGMKVLRKFSGSPGHMFYGHGIYSGDGKKLYMGQYPRGRVDLGHIVVLDGETLEPIKTFFTGGISPHSLSWMADGKTLAMGHYGLAGYTKTTDLRSSVTTYDTEKDMVTGVINSPIPNLYLCHTAPTQKGRLFILSHDAVKRAGKEYEAIRAAKANYEKYIKTRGPYLDFDLFPSPMLMAEAPLSSAKGYKFSATNENYNWGLSIVMHENNKCVGSTMANGNAIVFQDIDTAKVIHKHVFKDEHPRGMHLSLDEKYFVATTSAGNIHYLDAKSFQLVNTENPAPGRLKWVVHTKCVPSLV